MKKLLAMVLVLMLCMAACGAGADEMNWESYSAEKPDVAAGGQTYYNDDIGIMYWVSDKMEDVTPEDEDTGVGDAWHVRCLHWPDTASGISLIASYDWQGASSAEEYASVISGYEGVDNPRVISINGLQAVDYMYYMDDNDFYCVDYFLPGWNGILNLMAGPLISGDSDWADMLNMTIASVRMQEY